MSVETLTREERIDAYVLGLLDPAERDAFEAEMEADPSLVSAVGESRDQFVELDLAGRQVAVSPDLWERITARLDQARDAPEPAPAATGATLSSADVAAGSARAGAVSPANDNRLARWRRSALSAIAASVVLCAALLVSMLSRPEAQVIAVLMDDAGQPVVMIEDFGNAAAKVTPLVDYIVPDDRSLQVWTLPTREMGPVSLGVLDGWRSSRVSGWDLPGPREEQLYEITVEPLGGSPTGRPTGPILGKGFAKAPRI